MNDFEDRLRRTPLRTPPSEWRNEVVLAASAHRNWRAEIWPSLSAWGALAAVWLLLFAIERFAAPTGGGQGHAPSVAMEPPSSDSFLAYHAALNSANTPNQPH
jgi:hypothetical protein